MKIIYNIDTKGKASSPHYVNNDHVLRDYQREYIGKNIPDVSIIHEWEYKALEECYAKRIAEYPPVEDYMDAIVKWDEEQKQKYIDDCKAVKLKYPKQ